MSDKELNKVIKYIEEVAIPVTGSLGFDVNQFHGVLGELKTAFYLGKIDKTYKPAPPNTPDYDGVSEEYGRVSSKFATVSNKDSRIFLNGNLNFDNLFITKKENNEQEFYLIPRNVLTINKKEKNKIYLTKGSKNKLALAATKKNLTLIENYKIKK
jgi:hypothetical protein